MAVAILGFCAHELSVVIFGLKVANSGVSFGWFVNGLWLVLTVFVFYFLIFRSNEGLGFWIILIGGGINLVDRLRFGYVRDYWQLPMTSLYNNVNDWLIGMGTVIFIYSLWKKRLE